MTEATGYEAQTIHRLLEVNVNPEEAENSGGFLRNRQNPLEADVIIIDTAGRLHNKKNLMDELNKISRVIERELPGASKEVLLVLDATTGQNAVNQAKDFKDAAGITGIVLTKLDGTARGGVVLAINNELDVPVKFVGVGEQIDDLQPFDADAFAAGLFDKAPTEVDEEEIASFIGSAEAAADEKAEKGSQN